MMDRTKKQKSWAKMSATELAEATKQFDKPIRFEDTRPLTKKQRALFERMVGDQQINKPYR